MAFSLTNDVTSTPAPTSSAVASATSPISKDLVRALAARVAVPVRPVPRSVYKYYPQYRGYLFFVGRHGDFVIVSPRSHRIVAVL